MVVISGKDFKEKHEGKKFFKIINNKRNHNEFVYEEGLNVDTRLFNPHGKCESGGLYFTDEEHIMEFAEYGENIWKVDIPNDAQVHEEKKKYKADKIIISPFDKILYDEQLAMIKRNGEILYFVPNELKTKELCAIAVNQNGYALEFVPNEFRIDV